MRIFKPFEKDIPSGGVATLGFFDGVHIGHKAILEKVKKEAENLGTSPMVMTLWPHPRLVLRKDSSNLLLINTLEEKTSLIASCGLDHFVVIPFNEELSEYSPEDFFRIFFVEWLKLKKLIVGYDHHIGKNGSGDFAAMQTLGKKYGIEIERIDALSSSGINVSSTKIRNLLTEGNVSMAAEFLGYNYFIKGSVEVGFQLGRKIGYPTANIHVDDPHKLIPADGVYAVEIMVSGFSYQGMLNIGYRPTISKDQHKTIEVNIFDFEHTIYGETITVRFIDRIRNELKFNGIDELIEQLGKDKISALQILNKAR